MNTLLTINDFINTIGAYPRVKRKYPERIHLTPIYITNGAVLSTSLNSDFNHTKS